MTKYNGNQARFYIGGLDLGDSVRELTIDAKLREVVDVTSLNDAAERVGSSALRQDTLEHSGWFDDGAGDVTGLLASGVGSSHVWVVHFGTTDENPSIHAGAQLATSYHRGVRVGDFVTARGQYASDEAFAIKATMMMVSTAISSFPHTDDTVDDGAASSSGGSAVLQVLALSGGTSITVAIDHSTDNFVASDDALTTFTAATGVTAERKTFTGTVRRYRRITVTESGGVTSATIAVSFQRD